MDKYVTKIYEMSHVIIPP